MSLATTRSSPKRVRSTHSAHNKTPHSSHRAGGTSKSSPKSLLADDGDELDGMDGHADKTVYETAGIVDRLDKLKSRLETELSKEASKSRWFSECQRSIEEKKVSKSKQDPLDLWTLQERTSSYSPTPLSTTNISNNISSNNISNNIQNNNISNIITSGNNNNNNWKNDSYASESDQD